MTISARLPPRLEQWLRDYCAANGRTKTEVITEALERMRLESRSTEKHLPHSHSSASIANCDPSRQCCRGADAPVIRFDARFVRSILVDTSASPEARLMNEWVSAITRPATNPHVLPPMCRKSSSRAVAKSRADGLIQL